MKRLPRQGDAVDIRYHQHTASPLTRRISVLARHRVYTLFLAVMRPGPRDRILDIGASDDTGPDSNMLEQLYPHRKNLTCASLSDGQAILAAYPGVQHVRIKAGEPLPFARNAFDIVYSNAVLEHAGAASGKENLSLKCVGSPPAVFLPCLIGAFLWNTTRVCPSSIICPKLGFEDYCAVLATIFGRMRKI